MGKGRMKVGDILWERVGWHCQNDGKKTERIFCDRDRWKWIRVSFGVSWEEEVVVVVVMVLWQIESVTRHGWQRLIYLLEYVI